MRKLVEDGSEWGGLVGNKQEPESNVDHLVWRVLYAIGTWQEHCPCLCDECRQLRAFYKLNAERALSMSRKRHKHLVAK